ncbi:MAG: hypothetical protein BIFFINMI_03681 [Phycisphaerae bacterium]|nr:hypothetical protein [Phycisphaerae bacterium]
MPTSFTMTIPWVMDLVAHLGPRSFLDVGCGSGRYGFLFREYLDYHPSARAASADGGPGRVEAVEVHADYLTPRHRAIYDAIHVGDASAVLPTLGQYDLVFCGDMIEHLDKPAGEALLDAMFDRARLAVVVATPARWIEQDAECGNEHERHRSLWRAQDFDRPRFANRRVAHVHQQVLLAAIGREGVRLPRTLRPWWAPLRRRARAWIGRALGGGPDDAR